MGQNLEICSQESWRRRRRQGLVARRCNPMKWTKLAMAVGDVGQAPKVEDLARSEGTGRDEEIAGEADIAMWGGVACSGDEVGGLGHRRARIALDAAPYLACQLS